MVQITFQCHTTPSNISEAYKSKNLQPGQLWPNSIHCQMSDTASKWTENSPESCQILLDPWPILVLGTHPSLHCPPQLMWLHSGEPDMLVMWHADQDIHWQAHQDQGSAIKNTDTEGNNV
jgi:hypothetical protein